MAKYSRRPLLSIVVLLCIGCAIYFVAHADNTAMSSPIPSAYQKAEKAPLRKVQEIEEPVIQKQEETVAELVEPAVEAPAAGSFTETPFMPKMANETLKAQLGNSAWHLLHTVLARYPDKPSAQEKATLKQYIHLFAQVYPCGDCARHFQQLLQKYPPQVGSRQIAAVWGCHVHNKVNERLGKPEYDCTTILEDYDCGCGADEKQEDLTLGNESLEHLREVVVDEKSGGAVGG